MIGKAPTRGQILNGRFKRSKTYRYTNGNKKYVGYHILMSAQLGEPSWEIYKYDEDGSKEPVEGPQQGAVNSETVINVLPWTG